MAINYSQSMGDYIAQRRAAAEAAQAAQPVNWRDAAYGENQAPAFNDWDAAKSWGDSQADPIIKSAMDEVMAGRMQNRGDSGDVENTFTADGLGGAIDRAWNDALRAGKTGLDMASASETTKNAYKLREQIIAANAPFASQVTLANKAGDENAHYGSLATQLADRGITDLSQLQFDGKAWTAGGKAIGTLNDAAGHGWTDYQIQNVNGKPVFTNQWKDSSDKGKIVQALSIAAMFVPGLGPALGSALGATGGVATALGNGLINGALTAAGGGNFVKGALLGGAGTGDLFGNIAGGLGITDKLGAGLINGAIKGGATSLISGGDIGKGILGGAVSGGLSGTNVAGNLGVDNKVLQDIINGAVKSGAGALVKGGNVGQAALGGAVTSGINSANVAGSLGVDNKTLQGIINKGLGGLVLGKDPKQVLGTALASGGVALGKELLGNVLGQVPGGARNTAAVRSIDMPRPLSKAVSAPAPTQGKMSSMDESDESGLSLSGGFGDYDWQSEANVFTPPRGNYLSGGFTGWGGYANAEDPGSGLDYSVLYPPPPPPPPAPPPEPPPNPDYSNEGGHYGKGDVLNPGLNSPVNGSVTGEGGGRNADRFTGADWFDQLMAASKTGNSVTGGGTSFSLGDALGKLLSGITGKDLLGMAGSGVTALMAERQAEKEREFRKETQQREWDHTDALAAAKRKRIGATAPAGLINAAIHTVRTGG